MDKWEIRRDKFYYFMEKYFIKISLSFLIFTLICLNILSMLLPDKKISFVNEINSFISYELTNAFLDRDSTLITLAAIFIGIYFTAFTLLATISSKSSFSMLTKSHFRSLLIYIRNAFLISFSYLIISLFNPMIGKFGWYYSTLCLVLLVYMLLSGLRFGCLIYLILHKDIDKYLNEAEKEEIEQKKINSLLLKLDEHLNELLEEKSKGKALEISELLAERKKKHESKDI